ncbi:MAG: MFS transporter [Actinomycetota bacterium]|nr:MFS transporter [Actinomycetota bacterium]
MISARSTSPFAAFGVRGFAPVWLSGLIWHLCRWGVSFLGTYLIADLTESPRMVQLAGTVLYIPLLVGGIIGGVVSDRLDRLRTVRVQLSLLFPLTILIGVLVRAGQIRVWMIYVYLFLVGIGWVTDMTSRRALIFDLVGQARTDNAMAMEALSASTGMVIGALVGGSALQAVGIGASYFVIAGFIAVAFVCLLGVEQPSAPAARPTSSTTRVSPIRDLSEGVRQLRRNPAIISILGVTAIANFFLFAYFPIIPVIARALDASPRQTGLLAAGTGIGMMVGSLVIAQLRPHRRGLVYVGGVFVAMLIVIPFARATAYPIALLAIIASGVGSGCFGAMQSALVAGAAPPELRGRALGLLSMAIGALPLGMAVLGEVAERVGVATALTGSMTLGITALAAWLWRQPYVLTAT